MKAILSMFAGVSLALGLALAVTGSAVAEDDVVTITGQVAIPGQDANGDDIVQIVTETDTYLVHPDSKADLSGEAGKQVSATGKVEMSQMSKTISVDEYALVEGDQPPVGAK